MHYGPFIIILSSAPAFGAPAWLRVVINAGVAIGAGCVIVGVITGVECVVDFIKGNKRRSRRG